MFLDEFNIAASIAKAKIELLKRNPLGYFIAAMLSGVYVGFGVLLISSIGGQLAGLPYAKIITGMSFSIGLSIIIMAGSELFTGNNFVISAGILSKTVKLDQAIKSLFFCYIGNWFGSVLLAVVFFGTGLSSGSTAEFISSTAAAKMSVSLVPLFLRSVLCNILVCLAVWCCIRCKSESGKLIMIFWCLFAFVTSGFEHSVANMTLLTIALLNPSGAAVSVGGYFYNIFVATLGNMFGGMLCVALPYYMISKKTQPNL